MLGRAAATAGRGLDDAVAVDAPRDGHAREHLGGRGRAAAVAAAREELEARGLVDLDEVRVRVQPVAERAPAARSWRLLTRSARARAPAAPHSAQCASPRCAVQ